jgi:hypothetical protein
MKMVIENTPIVTFEDSGCAMIAEVQGKEDSNIFVRVQSWDKTSDHMELGPFIQLGKKLRITIELVE